MNALTKTTPAQLLGEQGHGEQAVLQAGLGYIADPARRSLEHWWKECASKDLAFSSFRRRAHQGQWVERREQFWAQVSTTVLKERAGALAAAQARELADLETVRQSLLGELSKMQVKPRSLEGLVAALVAVDRRAEEKRASILARLDRVTPAEAHVEEKSCSFSPDEGRAMAQAVLQLRLQRQRERLEQASTNG